MVAWDTLQGLESCFQSIDSPPGPVMVSLLISGGWISTLDHTNATSELASHEQERKLTTNLQAGLWLPLSHTHTQYHLSICLNSSTFLSHKYTWIIPWVSPSGQQVWVLVFHVLTPSPCLQINFLSKSSLQWLACFVMQKWARYLTGNLLNLGFFIDLLQRLNRIIHVKK